MNALLINPDSPYLENAAAYPPMGLMYVAASLEHLGCNVTILDLAAETDFDISTLRHLDRFDLVGITCVTPNYPEVRRIMDFLPRESRTMIGGIHPTIFPEEVLSETWCSHVITGEFENVAHEVVHNDLCRIYRGGVTPVDKILKPARHLVDLHRYKPGGVDGTPVYTSRGCPFSCRFCSKLPQSKYREIPLVQVMDEVDECISLGFNHIIFGDDNIGVNPHRLHNLLDLLKTRDITFRLNMDSRNPKEDIFKAAAGAGCTEISFGVESGSKSILALMNKMVSPEESTRAIKLTQKYGMKAKAYFMVNFPGETHMTVRETLKFAEEARPDKWLLSSFSPLPGSFVYANPKMFGITSMTSDWGKYYLVGKGGVAEPSFETSYLTKERQKELHRMMYEGLKERLG